MKHLVLLYNSNCELSVNIRDWLRAVTPGQNITTWCDVDTLDAGFDSELVGQLRRADAIVFGVSRKGLGRYQKKNELDRVADAMRSNYRRRLVFAMVGDAEPPSALMQFESFSDRTHSIVVSDDDAAVPGLVQACFPGFDLRSPESDDDRLALKLIERFTAGRNLVIVVGPYAFAESEYCHATPAKVIERFMLSNNLAGSPPWIDVMGSIARLRTH